MIFLGPHNLLEYLVFFFFFYKKNLSIPIYIGGGIDEHKAKEIIKLLNPDGIDVSRGLKNSKNIISSRKLKNFLQQVTVS